MATAAPVDRQHVNEIVKSIREAADSGMSRADIRRELMDTGMDGREAEQLITTAIGRPGEYQASQQATLTDGDGDGGAMGWITWIGILVVINFLSWVFDWPFWVY